SSGPSKACANTPYQHTHQFEIWGLGSPVSTGFSEYPKYRDFIDEDALNTDSTGGNGQTFQSNNIERAVIKGV
ncbi:hypothetical protein WAE41_34480, partial [Pseudomonas aeruginosa]|uniref:hypothetical protein n=1 Tax=Pseudomonas aeruginosa TaxID=287 RepID=UPI00301DE8B5